LEVKTAVTKKMTISKRYASAKETAEYTGLALKSLYELASQRLIPSIKVGGRRILFDLQKIDEYMEKNTRTEVDISNEAKKRIDGVQ